MQLGIKSTISTITEFFYFCLVSILFQRGIYPRSEFARVRKWGVPLVEPTNRELMRYLKAVASQLKMWLVHDELLEVALIIMNHAKEPVERWQFTIATLGEQQDHTDEDQDMCIRKDIQNIMRQIAATVTVLPLLRGPHTIQLAVIQKQCQNGHETPEPENWNEALPRIVANSEEIHFHTAVTETYAIVPEVIYRLPKN